MVEPYISYESVRSALDAMLYTSSPQLPSPLEALLLVDQFISNPDLPLIAENREFALRQIILSFITREYTGQRHNFNLEPPEPAATLEAASEEIDKDGQQRNPELMGWCLLYYRYVRVDLGLTIESMMPIAHVEQRTLRRYHNHGIERLRDYLASAEWDVRTQQRKVRLYAKLPILLSVSLVGRELILQQTQNMLRGQFSRHVQINGVPGVGKSVFVQEFIRRQIDNEQIDDLLWIENPESVDFVRHLLNATFLNDLKIGLKEYVLTHNLAIILDHFECTNQQYVDELQQLLDELSVALVIVTSRTYIPLFHGVKHITIGELDEPDALTLIQKAMGMFDNEGFDQEYAKSIYEAVGGNPYALILATYDFSVYHLNTTQVNVLDEIFDQSYESLDDKTQRVWLAFALCPAGEISMDLLSRLWPGVVTEGGVMMLVRHYLIQPGQKTGHYVLPTSSRGFIQRKSTAIAPIRDALVNEFDQHLRTELISAFEIVEYILLSDWLKISLEMAREWININFKEAMRRGRYAHWASIIEKCHDQQDNPDASLKLALGMCLRRTSQWSRAQHVLEQTLFDAGSKGQFYEQSRALFELGILYRQQGRYDKANTIFEKVETMLTRYGDQEMLNDLRVERAQSALDVGEADQAERYLHDLPVTGRIVAMRSEISFLLGEFAHSLNLAYRAVSLNSDSQIAIGRLYAMIGRIYDRQDRLDDALSYFSRAITILEREGDVWALARTQSNMGALLIRLENDYEAYDILSRAENTQIALGDRVGLESTRHNFRVLRGRFGG